MPRTLRSIIINSIGLLLVSVTCQAQYRSDSLYGWRLGMDLSRIPMHFLVPERTDLELNADLQLTDKLFAVLEGGWNKTIIHNKPVFDYNSSGYFGRLGVDYNFLKPAYAHETTIIYGGIRYGMANMNYAIPQYQITDSTWGNVTGSLPQRAVTAFWIELVVGMKVEVVKNLFLGWSMRPRILLSQNLGTLVRPYIIPGYGKGVNNAVFDFNYSVSYKIPLFRAKERPPKLKTETNAPKDKQVQVKKTAGSGS
ncbi:MAG TPA: DUF6048 family protein [Chitinophagaceae bacterium]